MKASDLLILAGSAALAYLLLRWARQDAGAMNGYLRYANRAPPPAPGIGSRKDAPQEVTGRAAE